MDKLIQQVLEIYDNNIQDLIWDKQLTNEDVVYALSELGLIDLEDIIDGWKEDEETFD